MVHLNLRITRRLLNLNLFSNLITEKFMFSKFKLPNLITEGRNAAVALSVAVMAESAFAAPSGGN